MSINEADVNIRPQYDTEFATIADYVVDFAINSEKAYQTARLAFMDALGCAFLALQYPACKKLLGPVVPGTIVPNGSRVIGTEFVLDPILAAFNNGALIRWLDFNDTWLAAEWGHPSDNLGAILSLTNYLSRNHQSFTMHDVFIAMIKAYEIQGILALENSFNRVGLDHVVLVKVASAALSMFLLGGTRDDILNVLSHAFIDGQSLRTYRHAPNTGSRKSWAAGDATARGLRLAWMVKLGEMGYPSALSAKKWGFSDVLFRGEPLRLARPLNAYVMENILFKISFPAEFHAQTAVECAIALHPQIKNRLDSIEKIILTSQDSAVRIISKTGPLHNPADRDHCLQYMVAIGLIYGDLRAEHYEDDFASDPRIDALRQKMEVQENIQFSKDYLDPEKRSIANAIQIFLRDGSSTEKVIVEYPIGHVRRRDEGIPLLLNKFKTNASTLFKADKVEELLNLFESKTLDRMEVHQFMDLITFS